jgi:hypothetical protein
LWWVFVKISSQELFDEGWLRTTIPLISAYRVARIIGRSHQRLAILVIFWERVSLFAQVSSYFILLSLGWKGLGFNPQHQEKEKEKLLKIIFKLNKATKWQIYIFNLY